MRYKIRNLPKHRTVTAHESEVLMRVFQRCDSEKVLRRIAIMAKVDASRTGGQSRKICLHIAQVLEEAADRIEEKREEILPLLQEIEKCSQG